MQNVFEFSASLESEKIISNESKDIWLQNSLRILRHLDSKLTENPKTFGTKTHWEFKYLSILNAEYLRILSEFRIRKYINWIRRHPYSKLSDNPNVFRFKTHWEFEYLRIPSAECLRQWLRITNPVNWDDFRVKFVNVFKLKTFKCRVETRIRSRRQGLNEPVETYFSDVLCLCRQVEKETGTEMSEIDIIEYLLNGIWSMLLEKLWPLVPEPIDSKRSLLAAAIKHAQAKRCWDLYNQKF